MLNVEAGKDNKEVFDKDVRSVHLKKDRVTRPIVLSY